MISLILRMPAATQVLTVPEQAPPAARLTLDDINATYSFEIMPNSRVDTDLKTLDMLCDDSAEFYEFPPSWTIMYMAKLIPILYDVNGDALNEPWEIITPLHASFIAFMNDIDDVGGRPSVVSETHKFMGMPTRF